MAREGGIADGLDHIDISLCAEPTAKVSIRAPVTRSTKIVHQRFAGPSRPRCRGAFDVAQMTPQVSAPAITAAATMKSDLALVPNYWPLMRCRAALPPFTALVERRRSNVARCPAWATANANPTSPTGADFCDFRRVL